MNLAALIFILLLAGCAVKPSASALSDSLSEDNAIINPLNLEPPLPGAAPRFLIASGNAQPEVVLPPPATCISLLPNAADISWNTSPGMTYRLYWQGQPLTWSGAPVSKSFFGSYEHAVDADTNSSTTINGLEPGRIYYFAVTATDTNGVESDLASPFMEMSQSILVLNFPLPTKGVESSTNLSDWQPRTALPRDDGWHVQINPGIPAEFYRALQNQ